MESNLVQPRRKAAAQGRHRAPESDDAAELTDTDELTDTVAISPLYLAYGHHAAQAPGLPELWPINSTRPVLLVDDAAGMDPGTGTDTDEPGQRTAIGRLTRTLGARLRPRQRSA